MCCCAKWHGWTCCARNEAVGGSGSGRRSPPIRAGPVLLGVVSPAMSSPRGLPVHRRLLAEVAGLGGGDDDDGCAAALERTSRHRPLVLRIVPALSVTTSRLVLLCLRRVIGRGRPT